MNLKVANRTYELYGNLAFYPSDGVKINDRFFFYRMLLGKYEKAKKVGYKEYANKLGEGAKDLLTSNPFNTADEKGETRMIQHLTGAKAILETGIQYEYNNERKYIQEKINEYNKAFGNADNKKEEADAIKKCLESLNADGGIDYDALINLINILFSGLDNTMALYNHEKNHIESVNTQYKAAKNSYLNQIEGLLKSQGLDNFDISLRSARAAEKFDKLATKAYVEHHTYNITEPRNKAETLLKSKMADSQKAAGVVIGKKITEFLNTLFEKKTIINEMKTIIQDNQLTNGGYRASEQQIKGLIIQNVTKYFNDNTATFLSNKELNFEEIAQNFSKEVLENTSQSLSFSIRGLYSNFAQYGHEVQFFKENTETTQNFNASADGLYKDLLQFTKQIRQIKKSKGELTEGQKFIQKNFGLNSTNGKYNQLMRFIQKLERFNKAVQRMNRTKKIPKKGLPSVELEKDITLTVIQNANGDFEIQGLDQLKKSDLIKGENFLHFKTFKPATLGGAIKTIKKRTSGEIKNKLIEILQKAADTQYEEAIRTQLFDNLNGIIVSVGGPTNDEIKQQLSESDNFERLWSGKLNIKSDNITIVVTRGNFDWTIRFNPDFKEIDPLIEDYYKQYQTAYMDQIEQNMKGISNDKEFTNYERLTQEFFDAEEAKNNYIKKISELLQEAQNQLTELDDSKTEEKQKLEKQIKAQKAFLDSVKDSLYISSTTKTFNNYRNNIGFVGGSIGSGIVNQIENLNTLFTQAGMPLTDEEVDWLIFAAINCSPFSVVGLSQVGPVEQILGALSVFALFDEGGAELNILEKIKNGQKDNNSKIMHLYVMNGIYYPGSFVLQQALNNIQIILGEIEAVAGDTTFRNGIKITSNVSLDTLPNKDGLTDHNPWKTVSDSAIQATNLHVTFLAGLLSVINRVFDKLKNTEMPA